jgi:Fe-S oxidoreductase
VSPDRYSALALPRPKSPEEERVLLDAFLRGLEKLFNREDNWTFLRPLLITVEHCVRCQTCSEACHIFTGSGRQEIYRPTHRSEILRRLYFKFIKHRRWQGAVELDWKTVSDLAELAYRCNLCRRCAQACPMGADNGLVAHELRKLFSQEMGIAPKELHAAGSLVQLRTGSTTGMNPAAARDNFDFIDEEMTEKTGISVKTPWDVEGADVLLIHNAGEVLSWPENPGAFAVMLTAAGVNWTLSSELTAYDAVNYGLWYDDVQFARVALRQIEAARKLKVKRIVIGECGHAHKALTVIADRLLPRSLNLPRESSMTLMRDLVLGGRLPVDPTRNHFPVTLHDPCNMARLMGITEAQRDVLRAICPDIREMTPNRTDNYCCGGGSGFALMSGKSFLDWRLEIAGAKKMEQVLAAFADCMDPSIPKYICAPCSNCKGQFRDLLSHRGLWKSNRIFYGGLAELVVNAMRDAKPGFLEWEWR